ncbi:terminase gpA endonuclease subunit [Desulfofustis limnaeus]|uniref:Terminase n=1 Tax=Desulfofustis limnaeus TaxID=2740163 RepID=A0ABN6M7A5_9BACT|nr:terminase gpA endonuclease subunit [Desulfofustis limnaeus]BDD88717.1 terminase [Desulfofustis limnaeus]
MTAPAPCVDIRQSTTVRLRHAPDWLPEKYRRRAGRIRVAVRMCAGERRLLKKSRWIWPSEWAPKYRTVTYGPLKGSRWDHSFMPHFRGIMDASFFPSVRVIGNCKAPQTGSSAGVETILGFVADRKPGPAFVVYPDKDTASKRSTDYLQPMFTDSPRLRGLLTGSADDLAALRIKLKTMLVYMGWAGSVTSLGNISAMYLVGDEIDKWPEQPTKKEARTLDLFFERFRAFLFGAKAWLSSTPTLPTGPISVYLSQAQAVFDYWVRCPDCGRMELMEFDRIRFGAERDPQRVLEEKLARYVCGQCGSEWDDRARNKALQDGRWAARDRERDPKRTPVPVWDEGRELFAWLRRHRPERICFHSPAWISQLVSLSECASRFLAALTDKRAMHYFMTQIKAEGFIDYETVRETDAILALRDERPEGLVPGRGRVAALVAGVDTQDEYFRFVIRAFGWGLDQESWLIRYGSAPTLGALAQVLFGDQYRDADGLYYPLHLAVQDAMGHRTAEVYDFSRAYPGRVQPYKGAAGRRPTPKTWSTIDTYPGTNRVIPGGIKLVTCDSHHYKDQLSARLQIKPGDPGAFHLHGEAGLDYAQMMCAEYRDERGLWQCPKGKANHDWDCEMMALIAADILQIKYWPRPGEAGSPETEGS